MRRRLHGEEGDAVTETVILVPVLLLLIMTVVQFGLWYHAKQVATAAVTRAVDVARLPGATPDAGEREAADVLAGAGTLSDPVVHVERSAEAATAEVHGQAPRLVPGFTWQVGARATAPVERFVPPGTP